MKIYEYLIMTEYIGRDGIANIHIYPTLWLTKEKRLHKYLLY